MFDVSVLEKVNRDIAPTDQMWDPSAPAHYFAVGLSGLHAIRLAVGARASFRGQDPINDILDFGCGCGRVTRFLRVQWPHARTWVTDLRKRDQDWVVRNLGCHAMATPEPPPNAFDLIFLGSVFTHLPQSAARNLLAILLRALRDGGLLVFTTQGRAPYQRLSGLDWVEVRQRPWMSYGLSPAQVDTLLAAYRAQGYGYVDYAGQTGYGVTIAPAHWYFSAVTDLADVTQVIHSERGFDDHQDVLGFMKRPIRSERSMAFIVAAKQALSR